MHRLLLLLLLVLVVVIALAVQAPAWLLGRSVNERSGGLVELRNTSGTIWNGEADALVRGKTAAEREIFLGRMGWRVERIDWQHRALIIAARQAPAGPRPTTIALGADRIRFAGSARVPAAVAGNMRLLAGWTLAGDIDIDSDGIDWADGAGTGAATVLWHGATLVPPELAGGFALGEVTARIALDGSGVAVSIHNSGGDIELTGEASSASGKLSLLLQPRAGASGAQIAWLQSHTMGGTPRGFTIDVGWPR